MFNFVLGVVAGLIANYLSPPIRRMVERVLGWAFHFINPDRFDLTGTWRHTYSEPTPGTPQVRRSCEETVRVRHVGSIVGGTGEVTGDGRRFNYELRVRHNMVFGTYTKVTREKGNVTGNGLIQLLVSPDRLSMKGQATWFDRDSEKIESSYVEWTKTS